MIPVHRITHPEHPLHLNPSLIQVVEATPDTVVTLTNGQRYVLIETPAQVARLVRDWKAGILTEALSHVPVGTSTAADAAAEVLHFPARQA